MKFRHATAVVAILAFPVTAQAQSTPTDAGVSAGDTAPPPALTISGSAAIASDYRFRGVSQSDLNDIENAVAARTGSNPRAW